VLVFEQAVLVSPQAVEKSLQVLRLLVQNLGLGQLVLVQFLLRVKMVRLVEHLHRQQMP
jgi:hypothetical protein